MGLVVFQVVNGLSSAQSVITSRSEETRSLTKVMRLIERDFGQIVDRPIYDTDGSNERLETFIGDGDLYLVEFSRQGVRNPLLVKRPEVQRIAYGLASEVGEIVASNSEDLEDFYTQEEPVDETEDEGLLLVRYVWPSLDRADESVPKAQILFEGVEELEFEFLDFDSGGNNWTDFWPSFGKTEKPYAVKMKLVLIKGGNMERTFFIKDVPPPVS